ncbi:MULTISPECIES: FitA-like ribbon-helix-helix domain-containing protein [Sphingomonas]|jgi:plasmid stability protein|uniref:Plasmid stabilization protein n=1 Tax=Sphingomonas turrisvirgatae TaxID=1888892 RepID=A0A1E3LU68_9SPHN|nr:plasmid stabilization protein [Sphingomonas turrisvirgatae]ODP36360.1 plasmid stabilization protein [Sphingomonas turrisvirgatae]
MASITIREIDDALKSRLHLQAARHGRSMEDEARDILRSALSSGSGQGSHLVDRIRARVTRIAGVDLEEVPRQPIRGPVDLS